ncbi:M23 family metallopeptidase [Sorangium sp. So ce385]|uniref:M23 family metallopeptidase n=1 Tax=Sorangium sp. So ce385 TaxID=3133308 RepID=UPI003F5B6B73
MNMPPLFYRILAATTILSGCAGDELTTEDVESVSEAYRVNDPDLACGTPNTNLGEDLNTSGANAELQEWADSIQAMPSSATKTDLLNRLLTNVQGPATAFPDAAARETFLRNVRAPLPMTLPYGHQSSGNQVSLGQGWIYHSGGSHRGLDIGRAASGSEDPSFDVLAVADGKVIGVYFDGPPGGGGNTVVIEHTGENGKKIYSLYMHLRNGATNDANAVKNLDCGSSVPCQRYKLAANKSPLAKWWGKESDTITVTPGQLVKRGAKIARAGSTMTVMGTLDANGVSSAGWGNMHLHVYLAVPKGTTAPNDKIAVEVDAFGAYQKADSCYVEDPLADIDQPTYYSRLFAPFLPDFHDLGWKPFTDYPDYLEGMSYAPATLSFYNEGSFKVTGSYQYATSGFSLQVGVSGAKIDDLDGVNEAQVPRETRVRIDGSGLPVYDYIATPRKSGEQTAFWHQLTQAQLDSQYDAYVGDDGYGIGDFFPYRVAGVQFYAVLFTTSASTSNWLTYSRSAAQVQGDIASIPAGLQVGQVVADTTWSPPRFSMLAVPASGCAPHAYVDVSTLVYPYYAAQEAALGYKLRKVQVYSGGSKFNAVFGKASGACHAHP